MTAPRCTVVRRGSAALRAEHHRSTEAARRAEWHRPSLLQAEMGGTVLDHSQEALCDAARAGSTSDFVAALAASADPSALTVGGESPVVACASVGRLDLLNKLLSAGASADASSSSGLSALAAAAAVGHLACVEALLAAGAEVDAPCGRSRSTPLSYAAQEAHRAVCVALLEAGADATAKDAYGTTPIEYAERHEGARRGDATEFERCAAAAAAAQFFWPPLRNSMIRGALTRSAPARAAGGRGRSARAPT